VEPGSFERRDAAGDPDRVDELGFGAEPPHVVLGPVRIAVREAPFLADGLAVHGRAHPAEGSPPPQHAGAEVVFTGEQRPLGERPLEEQPIAIALADLEAERDLEAADREHEQRQLIAPRRRHLQRCLDVEDPRGRPVDRVAVELDRARDPIAVDHGFDARPADDEAILVERRPRRAQLVLRGLPEREVVLIEAGEAEAVTRARDRGRRLRGGGRQSFYLSAELRLLAQARGPFRVELGAQRGDVRLQLGVLAVGLLLLRGLRDGGRQILAR